MLFTYLLIAAQMAMSLADCQDRHLVHLLQSLYGSNASVRKAAQDGKTHSGCGELDSSIRSQNDVEGHFNALDNLINFVGDESGFHYEPPSTGLALYAYATPFILVVGQSSVYVIDVIS